MEPQYTPGFFDDDGPKLTFDFVQPDAKHQKDLNIPPLLAVILTCKCLSSNTAIQGVYALHNSYFAYYEQGYPGTPSAILELSNSRLKFPSSIGKDTSLTHNITMAKNGNSFEFQFAEKQIMEHWIKALKNVCIMTNFHEEYKATKMIGKGSFAKVYLVDAKTDGKKYAVKAFAKESIGIPNKANPKTTMLNEINLMRTLDHENIIKLFEVHETERSIYLVMELIEGRPLQEPLGRLTFKKEYSERKVMEMIHSIVDALAYMAAKGIMHRDLKPDNILVDKTGKLKIVDFGLATEINVKEYIFKKCGTPGYIAPEVFRFDPRISSTAYNDRCDVFSAGCILFYMLFGYPFFDGSGASEILQMNKEFSELDPLYAIKKEKNDPKGKINKEGLNLIVQLLEFDQKKRVTAVQALSATYFQPMAAAVSNTLAKISSYKEIASLGSLGGFQSGDVSSPTSVRNDGRLIAGFKEALDKSSPVIPARNRYTEKDSLYLDVGKPEMNGKLDSISNGSVNGSLFMKGGDTPTSNNNSVSSFAKKAEGASPDRLKGQSRSFKAHTPTVNQQSFLKAAIFNNIAKNTDMGGNDGSRNDISPAKVQPLHKHQRHNSDLVLPTGTPYSASSSGGSDELNDDGEENCQIERDFESIKVKTPKKHPSKAFQCSQTVRMSSLTHKKKDY